jgi:hypothetical protein
MSRAAPNPFHELLLPLADLHSFAVTGPASWHLRGIEKRAGHHRGCRSLISAQAVVDASGTAAAAAAAVMAKGLLMPR